MEINAVDSLLCAALVAAVIFDLTRKKIPNFLTVPLAGGGLLYYTIADGFTGLRFSGLGLLLGVALLFLPFALGGMGGGDVKLMAAVGALKGAEFILYAGVFAVLAGGMIALILVMIKGQLVNLLQKALAAAAEPFFTALYFQFRLPLLHRLSLYFFQIRGAGLQCSMKIYLPYAVPIAVGVILAQAGWGELLFKSIFINL